MRHLADGISRADIPIKEAFEAAYDRTDREFEAACAANQELHSGTTAIAVLISGRYSVRSPTTAPRFLGTFFLGFSVVGPTYGVRGMGLEGMLVRMQIVGKLILVHKITESGRKVRL